MDSSPSFLERAVAAVTDTISDFTGSTALSDAPTPSSAARGASFDALAHEWRATAPDVAAVPCPPPSDGTTDTGAVAELPELTEEQDTAILGVLGTAHRALDAEIAEVRRGLAVWGGDKPVAITTGVAEGSSGDTFLYRVTLKHPVKAPDFTPVDVEIGSTRYSGMVDEVWESGRVHVLALTERIRHDDLTNAILSFDPTGLLMAIQRHLGLLAERHPTERAMAAAMVGIIDSPTRDTPLTHKSMAVRGLNTGQIAGAQRMVPSPFAVLHGPPGTGKTRVLGSTAACLADTLQRRVLVLAPTNVALDTALASIVDSVSPHLSTKMLRVGRHVKEFKHLKLTSKERATVSAGDAERQRKTHAATLKQLTRKAEQLLNPTGDAGSGRSSWQHRYGNPPAGADTSPISRLQAQLRHVRPALQEQAAALQEALETLAVEQAALEKAAGQRGLKEARIVGMTLAALMQRDPEDTDHFDSIVIDEGSMALVPQLLAASRFALKQIHVYGDPQQLGPIVAHEGQTANWLKQTLWHHLGLADPATDDPRRPFLSMQYRMDAPICALVSDAFYAGRLVTAPSVLKRAPSPMPIPPVIVIDTWQTNALSMSKGSSRVNASHIEYVVALLNGLDDVGLRIEDTFRQGGLGVVTPFAAQQYAYKEKLDDERPGMLRGRDHWVRTIHRAQGGETPMLLFDSVDSGKGKAGWFTSDANSDLPCLVNVALSRAQRHLILVANTRTLSPKHGGRSGLLTKILRIAVQVGCYIELPPEGMTPAVAGDVVRTMRAFRPTTEAAV